MVKEKIFMMLILGVICALLPSTYIEAASITNKATATFSVNGISHTIESNETYTDLSRKMVVYPNPCYPHKGQVVRIVSLPLGSDPKNLKVNIYTISGELVRTLEAEKEISIEQNFATAIWDLKNEVGEEVTRGIYIYLIINDSGDKRIGKIAVIK